VARMRGEVEPDVEVREAAVSAVSGRGIASEFVDELVLALRDGAAPVRCRAAQVLAEIPELDQSASEALLPLFEDEADSVRAAVIETVSALMLREAEEPVARLVTDEAAFVRVLAVDALSKFGGAAHLDVFVDRCKKDPEAYVRLQAMAAIRALGTKAAAVVPEVAKPCLAHADQGVRIAALDLVKIAGPAAAELKPQVCKCLRERDLSVKRAALEGIAAMEVEAVEEVAASLTDEDSYIRRFAASALAKMGPAALRQREKIVKLLEDSDDSARLSATKACASMALSGDVGVEEQVAVLEQLSATLERDTCHVVRWAALQAIHELYSTRREETTVAEPVVALCGRLTTDGDEAIRYLAMRILSGCGPETSVVGDNVLPLVKDEDARVRQAAIRALSTMDEEGLVGLDVRDRGQRRTKGNVVTMQYVKKVEVEPDRLATLLRSRMNQTAPAGPPRSIPGSPDPKAVTMPLPSLS